MTSDAWDNFIAALNPATLEQERMRPPDNPEQERPGSAADRAMRHRHTAAAINWHHSKRGHIEPLLTETEGWFLRSIDRQINQQREAEIRAYARARRKRAA